MIHDAARPAFDAAVVDGCGAHNFMDPHGTWVDDPHDGDHGGRAIWALRVLSAKPDSGLVNWAYPLFERLVKNVASRPDVSAHSRLYTLTGVAACPDPVDVRACATSILDTIQARLPTTATWAWPEPAVRCDAALIAGGQVCSDTRAVRHGLRLLEWLTNVVTVDDEVHRYPGLRRWRYGDRLDDSGDEQPLEAAAFAAAHHPERTHHPLRRPDRHHQLN